MTTASIIIPVLHRATEFGKRVRRYGYRISYCATATTRHPARNKAQQLRKNRRIACGQVQAHLYLRRRPALPRALMQLALIGCSPFC